VSLEPRFEGLLPEVMLGVTPDKFALIAATSFRPKQKRMLSVDHIHQHRVSIRETADILRAMLIEKGTASFSEIVAECTETMEVVARFLALLELYREKSLAFEQEDPLGPLQVTWVGGMLDDAQVHAGDEDEDYG
jgi:segregation and condensation protein A